MARTTTTKTKRTATHWRHFRRGLVWVRAYTRKDGTKVCAHFRSIPGRSRFTAMPTARPATVGTSKKQRDRFRWVDHFDTVDRAGFPIRIYTEGRLIDTREPAHVELDLSFMPGMAEMGASIDAIPAL